LMKSKKVENALFPSFLRKLESSVIKHL